MLTNDISSVCLWSPGDFSTSALVTWKVHTAPFFFFFFFGLPLGIVSPLASLGSCLTME